MMRVFSGEKLKFFALTIDQALISLVSLSASVVFARSLSKDVFADYILLLSVTMFFLGFQRALVNIPYSILFNDYKEEKQQDYFSASVFFKLCLSLVFSAILFILKYIWDIDFITLVFYQLFVFGYTLFFFLRDMLLSEREIYKVFNFGLINSFFLLTFLGVFYFLDFKNIQYFYFLSFSIYSISSFVFLINKSTLILITKAKMIFFFTRNFKVGKWILGSNTLFHISNQLYPWFLLYFSNKEDIAVLGVLVSVSNLVNPFLMAMNSFVLPLFVKENKDYSNLHSLVLKWLFLFMTIAFLLLFVGYFLGEYLLLFMFGDKYSNLGYLIMFPFINQALKIAFEPITISLVAIKRTDISFWVFLARTIFAVLFGIYFVFNYGLLGVFYTKIMESILYTSIQIIIYKKLVLK